MQTITRRFLLLILTLFTISNAQAHDPLVIEEGARIQPKNLFPKVKMETNFGNIVIELNRSKAPITVNNFLRYVAKDSYNGTIFHRIIPGFVVQGGGYDVNFREIPSYPPIINESGNGLKNTTYSIAMARKEDPHTANRQFYFNLNDTTNLDPGKNWGYTVFGEAVEGTEILDKMAETETHYDIKLGWKDVPVEPVILLKATVLPEGQ
ncbi:peptidylprolyl isomerase [Paraneptunicella aestuarii]|uniref:peptidylprolyl isomerase n=1 Tax=Paraneptunicella aestuarii TaxID=2831148 RepID=UPI001E65942C|nr:peptidylprolyl isomerase [Paraneptunicella aestuarii]UAA39557.1 peptidylprolyl isomerase [Paraneptunicella aestuarii]